MKTKEYIKKTLVCLLLAVYVFGILKPLSPIINDIVSHTFDKANHMATVHFENGKYHVHKEIIAETKNDTEEKSASNNLSNEDLLSLHLQSNLFSFPPNTHDTSVVYTDINIRFSDIFFKTYSPPPEA